MESLSAAYASKLPRRFGPWMCALMLIAGCGRYFGGPVHPAPEEQQAPHMVVKDDGSVTYVYERLEIGFKPMTDEELNRQFATYSNRGPISTNPYTYGDWKPLGESWTPPKFTVFLLKVKNYAYPKMLVDPNKAELISEASHRRYKVLTLAELSEYYYAHALGYAGNFYRRFDERKDILNRTLYQGDALFSGQESEGYVVFPKLDSDVRDFSIRLRDIVLRFDFRNEPVETTELTFRFHREVHRGYEPPSSLTTGMR